MRYEILPSTYYVGSVLAVLRAAFPKATFGVEGVRGIVAHAPPGVGDYDAATWRATATVVNGALGRAYSAGVKETERDWSERADAAGRLRLGQRCSLDGVKP